MTGGPWLRAKQAAEYIGVCQKTLYTMRQEKRGPPYRVLLNRFEYAKADLDEWLASKKHAA